MTAFDFERIAVLCDRESFRKRLYLSPNEKKPTLTLRLRAGENSLHAAEELVREYAALAQ